MSFFNLDAKFLRKECFDNIWNANFFEIIFENPFTQRYIIFLYWLRGKSRSAVQEEAEEESMKSHNGAFEWVSL